MNHADKDVGIYAAQLYLESLNVLGSTRRAAAPELLRRHGARTCRSSSSSTARATRPTENTEQCDLLTRIQCDIQRLKAQKLGRARRQQAKAARTARSSIYEKGGDAYIELWRDVLRGARSSKGEASQCEKRGRDRLQRGARPSRPRASSRRRFRRG